MVRYGAGPLLQDETKGEQKLNCTTTTTLEALGAEEVARIEENATLAKSRPSLAIDRNQTHPCATSSLRDISSTHWTALCRPPESLPNFARTKTSKNASLRVSPFPRSPQFSLGHHAPLLDQIVAKARGSYLRVRWAPNIRHKKGARNANELHLTALGLGSLIWMDGIDAMKSFDVFMDWLFVGIGSDWLDVRWIARFLDVLRLSTSVRILAPLAILRFTLHYFTRHSLRSLPCCAPLHFAKLACARLGALQKHPRDRQGRPRPQRQQGPFFPRCRQRPQASRSFPPIPRWCRPNRTSKSSRCHASALARQVG